MSFPDIHKCMRLTAENEELRKKYIKVKEQRDTFYKELKEIREKQMMDNLLKNYVTTRETSCQTDPGRIYQPLCLPRKNTEDSRDNEAEKTKKLLSMHNHMMRRYEKEVKLNMKHMETITDLNIQLSELEKKFVEERDKNKKAQEEILGLHVDKHKKGVKKNDEAEEKLAQLKRECCKIKKENEKLRTELKGLDFGFFEEIEDIKFALQQSARLNKEYEQTLRKLCTQFGVPYPHPEKRILDDKRTKWK